MQLKPTFRQGFTGKFQDQNLTCHSLVNPESGMEVILTNYGPTIIELNVPGKDRLENVILGYDNIEPYKDDRSQGRVAIGRWANRIARAQYVQPTGIYSPEDEIVKLQPNNPDEDPKHSLHGGPEGWAFRFWRVMEHDATDNAAMISFLLESPHLDQGFPGNVQARVNVILTKDDELVFEYSATTDYPAAVNMTFHGYLNLDGVDADTTIHQHQLKTNADRHVVVDGELIPRGDIADVANRFDFGERRKIGGPEFGDQEYDNCFVFPTGQKGIAELYSPATDILMQMETDQPAVQLYTGNHIGHRGLCLEAGKLVDAVNRPGWWGEFGNPFTTTENPYYQRTSYKFSRGE